MRSLVAAAVLGTCLAVAPSVAKAELFPRVSRQTTQEIGGYSGFALGGRVTAGGLRVGGAYLYRLAEVDWLDSSADFVFGGTRAECFRNRADELLCEHGAFKGFSGKIRLGVRRYFSQNGVFTPFARAGVAIGVTSFSGDEVTGLTVPLWGGGGIRAQVVDRVTVVGALGVELGLGFYNRTLGTQPMFGFGATAGVEIRLD